MVWQYFYNPVILGGVVNTLKLTLLSMALALLLGIVSAVMRLSKQPGDLRWVAAGYIWFFRGTPVLVQLLIWFNLALIFNTLIIPGRLQGR